MSLPIKHVLIIAGSAVLFVGREEYLSQGSIIKGKDNKDTNSTLETNLNEN